MFVTLAVETARCVVQDPELEPPPSSPEPELPRPPARDPDPERPPQGDPPPESPSPGEPLPTIEDPPAEPLLPAVT